VQHIHLLANLPNLGEILQQLAPFDLPTVLASISNYAEILRDPAMYKARPEYPTGFLGFMTRGVEHYRPDARPRDRCRLEDWQRVKGGEQVSDEEGARLYAEFKKRQEAAG
jgi:hypothetical protein